MHGDTIVVALRLEGEAETDAQELDNLTTRLRQRLLELDVQSVNRIVAGEAPDGARAADVIALGGLLVTLVKSPELLKTIASGVQSWLSNRRGCTVVMEVAGDKLEVTGLSSEERQRLIDLWIERHSQ